MRPFSFVRGRRARVLLSSLVVAVCGGSATDLAMAVGELNEVAEETLPQVGVPTDSPALFRWLEAREYRDFASESAAHPSAGPHPVNVITYLNRSMEQSLASGSARHPVGAAAVKELLGSDGTLRGWAVMVKLYQDRNGGDAWYWYEVTSRDPSRATKPDYAGVGLGLCVGCHSSGRDQVRIPFPLR